LFSPVASGCKIWIGHYQEFEAYLKTAECVSIDVLRNTDTTRYSLRLGGSTCPARGEREACNIERAEVASNVAATRPDFRHVQEQRHVPD